MGPNLMLGAQRPQMPQQPFQGGFGGWGARPGGGGIVGAGGPRAMPQGGFGGGQVGIGPMNPGPFTPGGFNPQYGGGVGVGTQTPGVLGSFDHLKKKHTIKKSGLYRLKAGEQVVPLSALARAK